MKPELLHGTLEVVVLETLSFEPAHGYGFLYPALHRLERKASSRWWYGMPRHWQRWSRD